MITSAEFNKNFLICALDFPEKNAALNLVDNLGSECNFYKVGLELFIAAGYPLLEELIEKRNKNVFLDLKLNDIPKTIERSVKVIADYGVKYISLYTEKPSLLAAREAIDPIKFRPKLINITVLTSMDNSDIKFAGWNGSLEDVLYRRAKMSYENGADGLVCSGQDLSYLKPKFNNSFIFITPGIRLASNIENSTKSKDDQKRIMTPDKAFQLGASHIVVGRPIKDAKNPLEIVKQINATMHI